MADDFYEAIPKSLYWGIPSDKNPTSPLEYSKSFIAHDNKLSITKI